jgi:hypothetical protein
MRASPHFRQAVANVGNRAPVVLRLMRAYSGCIELNGISKRGSVSVASFDWNTRLV